MRPIVHPSCISTAISSSLNFNLSRFLYKKVAICSIGTGSS
ncbi:hypothetical protein ABOONEI_3034 [Aciduliprofundum boonei T469]|nr:hypothetical protein ABOONEI_3034 [Aciduliprofundum boonei T469]